MVRCAWSLAKFFSPIPRTFISSCTDLKLPPAFWRYSTMRAASFGPTPGSAANCSAVAVLTLTLLVGAAFAAASAVPRSP